MFQHYSNTAKKGPKSERIFIQLNNDATQIHYYIHNSEQKAAFQMKSRWSKCVVQDSKFCRSTLNRMNASVKNGKDPSFQLFVVTFVIAKLAEFFRFKRSEI